MELKKNYGDREGLGYADRQNMHTISRLQRGERYTPAWALNDAKIRLVVYCALHRYVSASIYHDELTPGIPVNELEMLARKTQEYTVRSQTADWQAPRVKKHAETTQNLSGTAVRLLYLAYRRGFNSPTIADELGMSPVQVRQRLRRLNDIARTLFPASDCGEHIHNYQIARSEYVRPSPVSEETANLMIERYQAGSSLKAIILEFHRCSPTVRILFTKRGVKLRGRSTSKFSVETVKAMADYCEQGNSQLAVAAKFGLSAPYVSVLFKRHHIPRRPRGGPGSKGWRKCSPELVKQIIDFRCAGNSIRAVSEKFGISQDYARNVLAKHGAVLLWPTTRKHGE